MAASGNSILGPPPDVAAQPPVQDGPDGRASARHAGAMRVAAERRGFYKLVLRRSGKAVPFGAPASAE